MKARLICSRELDSLAIGSEGDSRPDPGSAAFLIVFELLLRGQRPRRAKLLLFKKWGSCIKNSEGLILMNYRP
jgi:hypothetical protein